MQFIFISTLFKSLWLRFFLCFVNICLPSLHLFERKNTVNSKYCKILLQFWMYCKIWIYCQIKFIPVIKAEFSASLILQSSVLHDPSKIIIICWFAAQETFLIIIIVENSCAASYLCGNRHTFFYITFFDEQKVQKHNVNLKCKCLYSASLLNKSKTLNLHFLSPCNL